MCFFRFFNALSCTGKHATSVMFYKVKMTKKADFWPNATCHLAVQFLNTTEKKFFFGPQYPQTTFFFFLFYVLGLFLYVRIEERKKEEWSKQ